jgi:hypothetical protein
LKLTSTQVDVKQLVETRIAIQKVAGAGVASQLNLRRYAEHRLKGAESMMGPLEILFMLILLAVPIAALVWFVTAIREIRDRLRSIDRKLDSASRVPD